MKLKLISLPLILIAFAGCRKNSTEPITPQSMQTVYDLEWLPDESGLVAYIETTTASTTNGSLSSTANVYHVSSEGSVGNAIVADTQSVTQDYFPLLFISPDGKSVLTQFGTNISSVELSSGNVTDIIQNTNLYGASAGLHYLLSSEFINPNPTKQLEVYDLTSNPIKMMSPADTRIGVVGTRALWIDSSMYALTVFDSEGTNAVEYNHVEIYGLAGNLVLKIQDAGASLHASAYAPVSRDLFVYTNEYGIDRINLATGIRTHIISNDTVESFDVTADGTLLVYSSASSSNNGSYRGFAVNVNNGHKAMIASSMAVPFISPMADRVAFISLVGNTGNEAIGEVAVSLPQ